MLAAARAAIDAAGLSGRVVIHQGPLDPLPYSDYLFNLVVNEPAVMGGSLPVSRDEAWRAVRPYGGVAVSGPDERDVLRRGPLDGAGEWTHTYADAGNTACSGDRRVASRLQLQWFGQPGPRPMIDRHHRTVSPVFKDGRLFVPGEDRIIAVDAYNGAILWERQVSGSRRTVAFRDCSYLVAAAEHVYVAVRDACLALHPPTGEVLATWSVPAGPEGKKQEWGYVGVMDNVLVASAVNPGSSWRTQSYQISATIAYSDFVPAVCSNFLFALDRHTGNLLWSYRPKSGLVLNPSIAIGDKVYFIESTNPDTQRAAIGRIALSELLGKGSNLVALDLRSGKVAWSRPGPFLSLQHNAYLCYAQGKVVVVGSRNTTDVVCYDIHVFDSKTGETKWFKTQPMKFGIGGDHGEQDQHPVIIGDRLYCEPHAYNLHSGQPLEWNWPWTDKRRRACGCLSASASAFFFRNNTAWVFDLATNQSGKVTTETRPGCWINLIPAGCMLLAPEASSGCTCNFSVQTSLGLIALPTDGAGK